MSIPFVARLRNAFPKGELALYSLDRESATFYFKNTRLKIKVHQLDCGLKAINKDLQNTLQARQYPYITIDLKQAFNLECSNAIDCDRWVEFETITDITLACETKTVGIPIHVKKIDETSFSN